MINRIRILALITFLAATVCCITTQTGLSPVERLGKKLFFDSDLSTPPGQSCSACHDPKAGWTGPDSSLNSGGGVYKGAVPTRFGNRKPPSAAYAGDSPVLHQDEEGNFVGGMFWDGRASGEALADPLAEQAMGPFLNPLEQNIPDKKTVVMMVRESDYVGLFKEVFPDTKTIDWEKNVEKIFEYIARAIAAFERSDEVNPFSSKFDLFWLKATSKKLDVVKIDEKNWQKFAGLGLSDEELKGLMLFNTKGKCSLCHVLESKNGKPPLFTDFTYDNLGTPKNPANSFYTMPAEWNPKGKDWLDKGLGGFLESELPDKAGENMGKHKVPTLRNVDLRPSEDFVKAYFHNGVFKTLKDVVHFYNTRDVIAEGWAEPEIKENVNKEELGDLGLTEEEENAIVTLMKTLSDGFIREKSPKK